MKHFILLFAIVFLSACNDVIAALACYEDYTVEESASCPAVEPYQCSADESCFDDYDNAELWCEQITYERESECEATHSSDATYDDSEY